MRSFLTFVLGDVLLDAHHLHVHHDRAGHGVLPLDEDVLAVVATSLLTVLQRFSTFGFYSTRASSTYPRAVVVWSVPWETVILGHPILSAAPANQMIRERMGGEANVDLED